MSEVLIEQKPAIPTPAKAQAAYTTDKELEEFNEAMEKEYRRRDVRGRPKDTAVYKPIAIFPMHTVGHPTGTDKVDITNPDGEKICEGYWYTPKYIVEMYESSVSKEGGKRVKTRTVLQGSGFHCTCKEFLEKFEEI